MATKIVRTGPTALQDIAGQRFTRLVAIRPDGHHLKRVAWLCRCDCGNMVRSDVSKLRSGNTKSCGCYRDEMIGSVRRTHGQSGTRLHGVWAAMIRRCENPKDASYKQYGAKGVSVCERWRRSFADFMADVGDKPSPRHSLDRIDPAGDYGPGNVRWATPVEQARNRRGSSVIEHGGLRLTATEWGERLGMSGAMILRRLRRGWDAARALAVESLPGGDGGAIDSAKGSEAVEAIHAALRPVHASLRASGWNDTTIGVFIRRAVSRLASESV